MSEYVLAIDFECAGGIPRLNGFTQMGAVVLDAETGKKIAGFNMYSNMVGYEWEGCCLREFWSRNPERWEETKAGIAKSSLSCTEVVAVFVAWVRGVCEGHPTHVVSDNTPFDIGILKYFADVDIIYLFGYMTLYIDLPSAYLAMHAMRNHYLITATEDLSTKRVALAAIAGPEVPCFVSSVKHDHNPENDAHAMAERWVFVRTHLEGVERFD